MPTAFDSRMAAVSVCVAKAPWGGDVEHDVRPGGVDGAADGDRVAEVGPGWAV